jgi:hypothetical protein
MRFCVFTLFVAAFVFSFSCVMKVDKSDVPDCYVTITNLGVFTMNIWLEEDETGHVEYKYVGVGESETWYLSFPESGGCSSFYQWSGYVRATYVDSLVTYGGLSEERYYISDKKEIIIKDCPGWY